MLSIQSNFPYVKMTTTFDSCNNKNQHHNYRHSKLGKNSINIIIQFCHFVYSLWPRLKRADRPFLLFYFASYCCCLLLLWFVLLLSLLLLLSSFMMLSCQIELNNDWINKQITAIKLHTHREWASAQKKRLPIGKKNRNLCVRVCVWLLCWWADFTTTSW